MLRHIWAPGARWCIWEISGNAWRSVVLYTPDLSWENQPFLNHWPSRRVRNTSSRRVLSIGLSSRRRTPRMPRRREGGGSLRRALDTRWEWWEYRNTHGNRIVWTATVYKFAMRPSNIESLIGLTSLAHRISPSFKDLRRWDLHHWWVRVSPFVSRYI